MNKKKGFTLLELVVVIVILGVVAVAATPRFLDLQGDARNSTLNSMKSAINSSIEIMYGKLAMRGLENTRNVNSETYPDLVPSCGSDQSDLATFCTFDYGYPKADYGTLSNLVDGISPAPGEDDWLITDLELTPSAEGFLYSIKVIPTENTSGGSLKSDSCYLKYSQWGNWFNLAVPVPPPTIEVIECE